MTGTGHYDQMKLKDLALYNVGMFGIKRGMHSRKSTSVVNQQAATPTFPLHSTEARVDAAAAITNNADQLTSIPRCLQNPSKS